MTDGLDGLGFPQDGLDAAILGDEMFERLDGVFAAFGSLIDTFDDETISQLTHPLWPHVDFLNSLRSNFNERGFNDEATQKIIESLENLTRSQNGCRSFLLAVRLMLRVYRAGLLPKTSSEGVRFFVRQGFAATRPRAKNGMTPADRSKRNEEIRADFASSNLTKNSFIKRHSERKTYPKGNGQFLSASAIRDILNQSS